MKKTIGIIFVFCLGVILLICTHKKQEPTQAIQRNQPTTQEQIPEIIEDIQLEPEFVPEEEMENQSPENAERD
ncbi:MAG: hypothetical protein IKZ02_05765 [Alphaproteobacteria bacterium]|nr:hypothetical protein [Alphaproteobacteria bacterium]